MCGCKLPNRLQGESNVSTTWSYVLCGRMQSSLLQCTRSVRKRTLPAASIPDDMKTLIKLLSRMPSNINNHHRHHHHHYSKRGVRTLIITNLLALNSAIGAIRFSLAVDRISLEPFKLESIDNNRVVLRKHTDSRKGRSAVFLYPARQHGATVIGPDRYG